MKAYFYQLADALQGLLEPGETYTCALEGEASDFIRFNRNRVRQAGHIRQFELAVNLIEHRRHAAGSISLSGDPNLDEPLLAELIESLRAQRRHLDDDPHLLYATEVQSTEDVGPVNAIDITAAIDEIMEAATGLDLVGALAAGSIYRGFANSLGQRNWYAVQNFNFDWSLHSSSSSDKAVKCNDAGFEWNTETLRQKMDVARHQLDILERSAKTPNPGRYRAYLAPRALEAIVDMMAWGGFSLKAHRTRQTPLLKMIRGDRRLDESVSLSERQAGGLAPGFTAQGFIKPARVELIRNGIYKDCLVDTRSSREYGLPVNASTEFPQSLDMAAGEIAMAGVLRELDTGLCINNLWYCNFSDRNNCRITGMTRYACFWVRDGKIAAPLNVMRFDEGVYDMLGENLIGLTREREFLFDTHTYHQRSLGSARLPGALIENFTLTL